jgi:hypothetical protein
MELHLKLIGIISIGVGLIHVIFPKYFNWKEDLQSISPINKQLMYVHAFFIALIVLLMGIFCIYSSHEILHTGLGKQLALGFFIFWFTRLLFQFFVYSSKLWKGKLFETTIHILFSIMWAYFSGVFFLVYWMD